MTREEAIEFGKMWLQINEDAKDSDTYNFFKFSIEALEQEAFINKPCCISGEVCEHDKNVVLDKLRAEIAEYGSIWVEYKITGRRDKDIEQLVSDVLKQAKEQVLEVIDKYKAEIEG